MKVTASFSVLSDTIKNIQMSLENRSLDHISNHVKGLQKHEKEKLELTAALHLERIRQQQEQEQPWLDQRTTRLFEEGIVNLKRKIASCIENINNVLDEIRCLLIDLE